MKSSAPTIRPILFSFIALLALTALTSLVGRVNLGVGNLVLALVIATVQASFIAFFLMHALHGPPLLRVVLAGGVIWFLILVTLTWTDYATRGWLLASGK